MKKPIQEEYEDKSIGLSSQQFNRQEQSTFNYKGWFVSPNTPAGGQLFINFVILYAYYAAGVMDDNNYATVQESFVSTFSLQGMQVHIKKV